MTPFKGKIPAIDIVSQNRLNSIKNMNFNVNFKVGSRVLGVVSKGLPHETKIKVLVMISNNTLISKTGPKIIPIHRIIRFYQYINR